MSRASSKLLTGASGAAGGSVYVDDVFNTLIDYSGGFGPHTATTGLDMSGEGGMVWTKPRNGNLNHYLYDTVRGAQKALSPDQNAAEGTITYGLTGFTSTGFTFSLSHAPDPNSNVWWSFRKAKGFFDIVTYTGDGTTSRTINHNLGSVPGMIIVKRTDATANWAVYHRSSPVSGSGKTYSLMLHASNPAGNSDFWPSTPTSTQFFLGDSDAAVNASGGTYVAYLFGHNEADYGQNSDEVIIKCDSYTGNESSTGPTVNVGFEPQFVLIKSAGSGDSWGLFDSMRGIRTSGNDAYLQANDSAQEYDNANWLDLTATGFNITNSADFVNKNNTSYIYMAIRRPHKPASEFAATDLFTPVMGLNAGGGDKTFATTYPVDFHFSKNNITGTGDWYVRDRLRGGPNYLNFNDPRAESSHSYNGEFDHMDGIYTTNGLDNSNSIGYQFRRAPGFFDMVAYTGTGVDGQSRNHNLGVAPELTVIKNRDSTTNWTVQSGLFTWTNSLFFNSAGDAYDAEDNYIYEAPTATVFKTGNYGNVNGSGTKYIAYFFATVAGISKVGLYTGTGSSINVDCGFSAGARFVFIKRATGGSGDWYVWDTVRGIVAGNDPYLFFNSGNAAVTNTDYIDPLSSGFTVSANNLVTGLNYPSSTYFFLAIA